MAGIKEILPKSVDKPIVSEYGFQKKKQPSVGSNQSAKAASVNLLNLKAGYAYTSSGPPWREV